MHRCLQLAALGSGFTAPNPMVGAVLVYDDKIIGEGFHEKYGEPHAEVNCINSVAPDKKHLISESILYVSLEPCAHFGKTPPCADFIINQKIEKVIIGCPDSFDKVAGRGIERLRNSGVEVIVGVLGEECKNINRRFFCFHEKKRPYIILKWAQSANGFIAQHYHRTNISNDITNRLVHQWRSEEMAIMVGANTAKIDDPQLSNRFWFGKSPTRIIMAGNSELPNHLRVFCDGMKTVVLSNNDEAKSAYANFIQLIGTCDLSEAMNLLYQQNITSLFVEGGASLLQSFIDAGLWDETRIITGNNIFIREGLRAPQLNRFVIGEMLTVKNDTIQYYYQA